MKIYIAGKITGDPEYRRKFACAARQVEEFGHIALNPAELPEGMTPEEYMRICFAMLDVADEMWYLADAADSPGAFLEVQYCRYARNAFGGFRKQWRRNRRGEIDKSKWGLRADKRARAARCDGR